MGRLRALLLLPLIISLSLTANAQAPTTLQVGSPVERSLSAGQTHQFNVILEERNFLDLVVEQQGIDVIVRVFSSTGRPVGEFDSPNGADGPEHVSFVAAAAGTYLIMVSPLDPSNQTPGRYQIKILELRPATEQEIKDNQSLEQVKAKGIALLTELDGLISEIKSPFTRIKAQLLASQLLWEPDQKRAAKYLTDAANGVKELVASVDGTAPDYSQQYSFISQLRFEMTRVLAQRDPDAALSFLYSTVPPPNPYSGPREQASQESMLELSLANQILQKDPNRAVQIARKILKTSLSQNLIGTVSLLRGQNPELAAQLASEIAAKVLNEKLLKNPEAANITLGLLRNAERPERRSVPPSNNTSQPKTALLSDTEYRDLLQKAINEALSYSPPPSQSYSPERNAAWTLVSGLQPFGPELETVVPGSAAALQKKLSELSGQSQRATQLQTTITNSTVDSALETIEKGPADQREQLYLQLASREANSGDIARARQIVNERVTNGYQRRNALMMMDQQEIYRSMSKGKADEALRIISGLRTPKERAGQVAMIAGQLGQGQKSANAIRLIEQARLLLAPSPQAPDQEQLNALLEIARVLSRYDSKRSFEIVDPLVDQINDICTAARTLDGFGVQFFDDDELNLENGSTIAQAVTRLSNALGTLATANFDRAKSAADRLQLPEIRLRAYLDIAQQSINGAPR